MILDTILPSWREWVLDCSMVRDVSWLWVVNREVGEVSEDEGFQQDVPSSLLRHICLFTVCLNCTYQRCLQKLAMSFAGSKLTCSDLEVVG
jgi:hypothetical protein